ncbi:4387_t:CDS:2 [Cetraspora pellucida]|uniref:4387_t:CDS:1 n=1 Tax=Cetraspora pellucida TaxID=1433469 RepID=A0A9N8VMY3_9GLOM|nr:4387_t:CDS:2 [Cetraspora pellucida]
MTHLNQRKNPLEVKPKRTNTIPAIATWNCVSSALLLFDKTHPKPCDLQHDDTKRKAVVKVSKLALEEMITILENGPKTKERIMALEVEQRIINDKGMPWYLSLLQSASMTFDSGGNLFPVI